MSPSPNADSNASPLTTSGSGAQEENLSIQDGFLYTAGPALVSGATQAILFNPLDRALYVRVKFRRRRFLDKRNFERPFQGFMNAAVYRTLVAASYMFWQDSMRIFIDRWAPSWCQASVSPQFNSMLIGLSAGSVNGFALNTLQAVKFRMWSTDERGITFARTAINMYKEGGIPIFFRGCITTMVRDSVFGVVYETARRASAWRNFFERQVQRCSVVLHPSSAEEGGERAVEKREHADSPTSNHKDQLGLAAFLSNLVAALIASMLSSPFNYVRSIVYGTPAGAIPLGYMPLLKSFYTQFYYIYRHGHSYTERHAVPELREAEHGTSTTPHRPRVGGNGSGSTGASMELSTGTANLKSRTVSAASRLSSSVRTWAEVHRHHPFAAWMWSNSRLNIGWGSIRVGLGMAMSQSLFYFLQDYVRENKRTTAPQPHPRQHH